MKVAVEMTAEEFQEFMLWRMDRDRYGATNRKLSENFKLFKKILHWAVEPDPKKEGKYKIVDHDHMDDLYCMTDDEPSKEEKLK